MQSFFGKKYKYKQLSLNQKKLINACIPGQVLIPLDFKIKPQDIIVNVGDFVKEEQPLVEGFPIYASVPGEIMTIKEFILANGKTTICIQIRTYGNFSRGNKYQSKDWKTLHKKEIIELIKASGAFKSESTLNYLINCIQDKSRVRHLLIKGAEDKPSSYALSLVLKDKEREILEMLSFLDELLKAQDMILTFKGEISDTIKNSVMVNKQILKLKKRESFYPNNALNILVKEVFHIDVMEEKDLELQEILILDVIELYFLYEMLIFGKTKTEEIITISGKDLKESLVVKAKIGTSIEALLEEQKINSDTVKSISFDNPYIGLSIDYKNYPLEAHTRHIYIFKKNDLTIRNEHPCIECKACEIYCPKNLEVSMLFQKIQNKGEAPELKDCILCGLCDFVCPSNIPLKQIFENNIKRGYNE